MTWRVAARTTFASAPSIESDGSSLTLVARTATGDEPRSRSAPLAALERVQDRANPRIQSGIRERYYGGASATPTAIFPTLMKLKNHHLAKIENHGAVVSFERLLGSILDGVEDFPTVLSLPDQGRFALGYYHQRQSFFTKSSETEEVSHA